MLQYKTIYPETLELLKDLMQNEYLQDFFLVGGTALSLQLGHRISVDIDLFTLSDFDTNILISKLDKQYLISNVIENKNTLTFNITFPEKSNNIIKIDLIKFSYQLINPILETETIRLLTVEDIIPMKLSAIAGRGSKKDFYDIFFLLNSYSIAEMFNLFHNKYPNTNEFHILKSLLYFDDADIEPNPQTIEEINWNNVKTKIIEETNKYISNQI